MTDDIIAGRVPIGRDVYQILCRYEVDIEQLLAIISGSDTSFEGFFSGPINFDTIEGILRASTYTRPNPHIPSPETVTAAAIRRADRNDREVVDEFWTCKDQIYRHLINSPEGILADYACQLFMRRHISKISAGDYFVSEEQIFRKLTGLRSLLTSRSFKKDITRQLDRPVSYVARRFYINVEGDFFARDDTRRYWQEKENCVFLPTAVDHVTPVELEQDLFDDGSNRSRQEAFRSDT